MKLAASAAIIKDKKILLIKRSNYSLHFPGHWTLPGGRAEKNEPVNKTIVREIKEEVNLDFEPDENYHISIFKDRRVFHYLGKWSGEVKLQEKEATSYGWFTYNEALEQELGFNHKDLLEMLHKKELI